MITYTFKVSIAILFFALFGNPAIAQHNSKQSFYFELHGAALGSFGPSEGQAEINGGVDSLYYDHKKHFFPGFKTAFAPELTAGYQKNKIRFQSTVGYFEQDIALIQKFHPGEYPFVLAKMLSVRVSAMLGCSNYEKRGPYGFYTAISFGSVFPIGHEMNDQTKANFALDDFQSAAEYLWSFDESYSLALGKKGLYMVAGLSLTMPGLLGCVGKINVQPNSPYAIIRDKIKMYSYTGFLGFGYRLEK